MQKGPSIAFLPQVEHKVKKEKKRKTAPEEPVAEVEVEVVQELDQDEDQDDEEDLPNDADLSEADSDESLGLEDASDDDDGVEQAYAAKQVAARLKAMAEGVKGKKRKAEVDVSDEGSDVDGEGEEDSASGGDDDDDELLDIDNLVHESLLPKAIYKEVAATPKEIKKAKKERIVSTETPEERDARTIFLGNVPVDCSTSRVRHSPTRC